MLSEILDMLRSSIDAASNWLLAFFDFDSAFYPFFITFFTIVLVGRFILGPLFGQSWSFGSDRVRRSDRDKEDK